MAKHAQKLGGRRRAVLAGIAGKAAATMHRRGVKAAAVLSALAGTALVSVSLTAAGQATVTVRGDQTCSFSVADQVVSQLACTAATTAPPTTTAAPTTAPPTTTVPPTSASPTPSQTPSPTPTQTGTPPADWYPDASNTGVPAGLLLADYNGSSTIGTATITGKKLTGSFTVNGNAVIQDSQISGTIHTAGSGTLTLVDDEIIGSNTDQTFSVIYGANLTATRVNVHGGKANLQCMDNCTVTDSFFHDPYLTAAFHYDVIGSNGVDGMVLEHNTLQCKFAGHSAGATGGCSADLGFFGDFGPIKNVTVDRNYFMASPDPGYCVITGANKPGKAYPVGQNLTWTNNVFGSESNGKCGQYGPVDEWQSGNGNTWSGNRWFDGPKAGQLINE